MLVDRPPEPMFLACDNRKYNQIAWLMTSAGKRWRA
jgi:hypothetical protein